MLLILFRSFCLIYFQRMYRPTSLDIMSEAQKFQLQDRRPRMDEFQKAIRKVCAGRPLSAGIRC